MTFLAGPLRRQQLAQCQRISGGLISGQACLSCRVLLFEYWVKQQFPAKQNAIGACLDLSRTNGGAVWRPQQWTSWCTFMPTRDSLTKSTKLNMNRRMSSGRMTMICMVIVVTWAHILTVTSLALSQTLIKPQSLCPCRCSVIKQPRCNL